jgi:hypothetical protein
LGLGPYVVEKEKEKEKEKRNPNLVLHQLLDVLPRLGLGPYVEKEGKKKKKNTLIPLHPLDLVFWELGPYLEVKRRYKAKPKFQFIH